MANKYRSQKLTSNWANVSLELQQLCTVSFVFFISVIIFIARQLQPFSSLITTRWCHQLWRHRLDAKPGAAAESWLYLIYRHCSRCFKFPITTLCNLWRNRFLCWEFQLQQKVAICWGYLAICNILSQLSTKELSQNNSIRLHNIRATSEQLVDSATYFRATSCKNCSSYYFTKLVTSIYKVSIRTLGILHICKLWILLRKTAIYIFCRPKMLSSFYYYC